MRALRAIGGGTSRTDYAGKRIYADGRLDKILTEEGYIDFSGSTPVYHYFLTDHLGNNRVVLNQDGPVEQVNHYYPFGSLMAESTGGEVQPWKFGGKELDTKKGVNWADFGARQYDPLIAGWTALDPFAEKYYSCSPYAYCLNNPVNAVDPSGKLVIFINGMHLGDGGQSAYWANFDQAVMKHLNDYNVLYRDGSIGGVNGLPKNLGAAYRKKVGRMMGAIDIEKIIKLISDENGTIKETIKIITHSMGAAYGKGYVEAILNYLQKLGLPLDIVQFEANFAPLQPKDQQARGS